MEHVEMDKRDFSYWSWILMVALAACAGAVISQSAYMAVIIFIFSAMVYVCVGSPLKAVSLLVMFFPFSEAMYLRDRYIDVPGAKPIFVLGLFAVIVMMARHREADDLPKSARNLLIAIVALFSLALFRALPHLDVINLYLGGDLNNTRFLMSYYVKPLIFLLPFFAAAKFIKSREDLQVVINATTLALCILSLAVIGVFVFKAGAVFDIVTVTEVYSDYFGMHRNNLATFFIIGLPLVLYGLSLKRNVVRFAVVGLCLVGIGILFSRTAYLTTLLTFFAFSLFMHKHRLISWALFAMILLTLVFNNFISDRATRGLTEGDVNALSAGRIEYIWMPLLHELGNDPLKLLFGSGRYAISYSDSARMDRIQFVFHPHNMYLEQVLDVGLVGAIIFWTTLLIILKRVLRLVRSSEDEFFSSFGKILLISMFCFFVAGLTGRSLFPDLPESYIWLILGSAVALLKIAENRGPYDFRERSR